MILLAAFVLPLVSWFLFSDYWKETDRQLKRIADALDKK